MDSFQWVLLWVAAFLIMGLTGLTAEFIPVIFWIGLLILSWRACRKFSWPSKAEIAQQLEKRSGQKHRPVSGLSDAPVGKLSESSGHLWSREMIRKANSLHWLRYILPAFDFVTKDPYALRIAVILLLCVTLVTASGDRSDRLKETLLPSFAINSLDRESGIKIVVTPPSYTRKPTLIITGRISDAVDVPQDSKIRLVVSSRLGGLALRTGDKTLPLIQEGDTRVYALEADIENGTSITLRQFGLPRLRIPINYIKERPPTLTMREDPQLTRGGQMRFPISVEDDYGIRLIRLRAIPAPSTRHPPFGENIAEEQPVIAYSEGKPIELNPLFDLTGHPWAGEKVTVLLEAEDFAGLTALSRPFEMVLPEKSFRHSVARSIIEVRKSLIHKGVPSSIPTAFAVNGILKKPQAYDFDILVTLALRTSALRLLYSPTLEDGNSVISTLWLTALRIEDGNITDSLSELRKALDKLRQAIQDKKSPEEIAELMKQYREAFANYMMKLQKEVQKRMASGEITPLDPAMVSKMMDMTDLGQFLSQMEQEMMNGDYESALKKLEHLQSMSEMMNPSMAQPIPQDMQQAMKSIQDLQKIIDAQQALLDKTRANMQEKNLPDGQDAIRKDLQKIEKEGKEAGLGMPQNIPNAGEAMAKSSDSLKRGNGPGSIPHQQEALDQLRQGQDSMQQSLKSQMQKMFGMSAMPMMPGGKEESGKPDGKNLFGNDIDIPNKASHRKSEEILKLIRERAADLSRPQTERDYYQRLLRQW